MCKGRGGGQVVYVLTFYSDNLSSNPAVAYSFSVKFLFEKNENKQKEDGVWPFKWRFEKEAIEKKIAKLLKCY